MARVLLIAGILWASLPAALCEAACAPEPTAAHAEAMPCHGAAEAPEAPNHDADGCPGCQLDLAAASAPPVATTAHLALAIAVAPGQILPPLPTARGGAHPPREPPGALRRPYARSNAPLLN